MISQSLYNQGKEIFEKDMNLSSDQIDLLRKFSNFLGGLENTKSLMILSVLLTQDLCNLTTGLKEKIELLDFFYRNVLRAMNDADKIINNL